MSAKPNYYYVGDRPPSEAISDLLEQVDLKPLTPEVDTDYIEWGIRFARTNYQPIDCNFYDNFEAAIVQRRAVGLTYLDANGDSISETTLLRDLKTHRTEEFVLLASGVWLRLDRIVSVDGVAAGESCSF